MSGLLIFGVDPGLKTSGWCVLDAGTREALDIGHITDTRDREDMESELVAEFLRQARARDTTWVVALEDFVFRSPKVSHGLVKHAAEMGKLVGRLQLLLSIETTGISAPVVMVSASESKRDQPPDGKARKMGIPGKNKDERSAYYAALWVAGTMRLASGGRQ